ncbi:hypothetical protein GOODEAATRI_006873 [Goodea atripinnis]|uniref:Suppressor of cytokine signaling 3 n=1 Tax=Goodea atripinnis TaxID=208336 RepID=A0ABV0MZB8_9TELE
MKCRCDSYANFAPSAAARRGSLYRYGASCSASPSLTGSLSGGAGVLSPSPSLDASDPSSPGPWTRLVTPPTSPHSPSVSAHSAPRSPPPVCPRAEALGPLPLDQRAEAGGHGAMVVRPLAMSSVTPSESSRIQGSNLTPLHYKPFSSHEHYQQVMSSHRKLQESGFYWGAIGGRDANYLLRTEPPGTFLVRDSSDCHHFFTLSVRTTRGTKNLRVHSEGRGFFLEPDPQNTEELPQFDCVLKLIAHYMGKGLDTGRTRDGANGGNKAEKGGTVYLIHTGGEKIPLELRKPLVNSLSSLQHMCRRTLNGAGLGELERTDQLPQTLRDFMEKYDAPI